MSPGPARLEPADVERLERADFTYPEVGATAGGLPGGYHLVRESRAIGSGDVLFDAAAELLLGWQLHLRAGIAVMASGPRVVPGAVVVLRTRIGPIRVAAPCRVVYVVDEPDRRGFAYGTLPGHPERGEESFVVERGRDGTVTTRITAFSRPASAAARRAGPLGRLLQARATERYLDALRPR